MTTKLQFHIIETKSKRSSYKEVQVGRKTHNTSFCDRSSNWNYCCNTKYGEVWEGKKRGTFKEKNKLTSWLVVDKYWIYLS